MGTFAVVVPPPSIYFLPSVLQRQEPTFVEAFSPKPGMKASIIALSVDLPGRLELILPRVRRQL